MKNVFFALVLLSVCHLSVAEPFTYEVSLDYQQAETDFWETDTTSVRGTYYWKPVVANGVPLAEAAFMARASSVSLGLQNRKVDLQSVFLAQPVLISNPPLNTFPIDSIDDFYTENPLVVAPISPAFFGAARRNDDEQILSGAVHYVSSGGWIGDLAYSRSDDSKTNTSINFAFTQEAKFDSLRLGFGKYLGPASTVEFEYQNTSTKTSRATSLLPQPGGTSFLPASLFFGENRNSTDTSSKGYSVLVKTLLTQGEFTHALKATVGYDVLETDFRFDFASYPNLSSFNSDKSYALRTGFDYVFYLRHNLGLGLAYTVIDSEFGDNKALTLDVEWFVTPKVAVRAHYLSTDTRNSFTDSDGFGLGVAGRF